VQGGDVDLERHRRRQKRVEPFRPEDLDPAGREGPADQRPIRVDEAEDALYRNVVTDDGTHEADLLKDAADELGAIPATDEQLLGAQTEEATLNLERGTTRVALRVDDVNAGRCDGDVIDVRAGAGDAAVVKYAEGVGGELVELLAESLLADGASVPGLRRRRFLGDSEDQATELGVLFADAGFALAWRRSYSRRADAPGVPASMMSSGSRDGRRAPSSTSGGAGEASVLAGEQPRQRTVLVDRS
jgi:hypothetical protein